MQLNRSYTSAFLIHISNKYPQLRPANQDTSRQFYSLYSMYMYIHRNRQNIWPISISRFKENP